MLRILGLPATNSATSINAALTRHAMSVIQADLGETAAYPILRLDDFEMPIYRSDREEAHGVPDLAQRFLDEIGSSDGIIISFAEHNGNYTSAFKNVFDWASRIDQKVYQGKPLLLMSTSPGKRGGAGVLEIAAKGAPFFGGDVCGIFSLPSFGETFDQDKGCIRDRVKSEELSSLLTSFAKRVVGVDV
ncbi:MAG: NAD(P)H-dependent oxidoreductase [Pseudomonadota bacterium]